MVQSGRQGCLPKTTRCGMAQHCERFAGIDRPVAFCDCESLSFRLRIVLGEILMGMRKFGKPFRRRGRHGPLAGVSWSSMGGCWTTRQLIRLTGSSSR
jgi:hypothetical protein